VRRARLLAVRDSVYSGAISSSKRLCRDNAPHDLLVRERLFNELSEVRTESASVSTSSDKSPIEMIIGDWYLDDLGHPTREIRRRD